LKTELVLISVLLILIVGIPLIAVTVFPVGGSSPKNYVIPLGNVVMVDDIGAINLVNRLMELGVPVYQAQTAFSVDGQSCAAGDFIIPGDLGGTADGISVESKRAYFNTQAVSLRVWQVIRTDSELSGVSKRKLVLPRVVIPFGRFGYINNIWHYLSLKKLGFKVVLANPTEIENGTIFNSCNVMVLPGSSSGLGEQPAEGPGIQNIRNFVRNGGGIVGTCAGGTQLSMSSWAKVHVMDGIILGGHFEGDPCPPEHLNDYDYWYLGESDGEFWWKMNTGPQMLNVTRPDHPTMFGLGPGATRFGYQYPQVFYFGGDTLEDLTANETVVATFKEPTSQNTNNPLEEKYSHRFYGEYDNWGYRHGAVIVSTYGSGRCVYWGPHPECAGMYGDATNLRVWSNAIYWAAQNEKPLIEAERHIRYMEQPVVANLPSNIESSSVDLVIRSVDALKVETDRAIRAASETCQFVPNDQYLVMGAYAVSPHDYLEWMQNMYRLENELRRTAINFQYEYDKLNLLKGVGQNNPALLALVNDAQAKIVTFFNMTINLDLRPTDPKISLIASFNDPITKVNYTFPECPDPTTVEDLVQPMGAVADEIEMLMAPHQKDMSILLGKLQEASRNYDETLDPTYKEQIANLTSQLKSSYRDYGVGPSGKPHPYDVLQFRIGYHLFNLCQWADRTREAIQYLNSIFATAYPLDHVNAELMAFLSHPAGPFT